MSQDAESGNCYTNLKKEYDPICLTCCGCCSTLILIAIIFIFIQIGTQRIEYNQYAFKKSSWSNTVDTDTLYGNGRHWWGFSTEPIFFPANCLPTSIENLAVADKEEKSFKMNVNLCYKLIPDFVKNLYEEYGTEFAKTVRSTIESTIKNQTPEFSIQDYLDHRDLISELIVANVTNELEVIWIEIPENKMHLQAIIFEDSTLNEYNKIAVDFQNNLKSEYDQQITFIEQNTTKLVDEIDAQADLEIELANANYDAKIEIGNAEAFNITQSARGQGITDTMETLGITNSTTKLDFIRIMDIIDNENDVRIIDTDNTGVLLNF